MGVDKFGFNPVPKPTKQNKEKNTPKYKEKRPKRKKKKLQVYKGVTIPPNKVRNAISKKDYQKALEHYGGGCAETGSSIIEMHHIKFRSQLGRGTWRNLVPLTKELHGKCHTDREYADYWRKRHEELFGPHYHKDRFDLWKEGLIERPTEELMDKFFDKERERIEKGDYSQGNIE